MTIYSIFVSNIPFSLQKYIIKQAFELTPFIKSLKYREVCFIFISFIPSYPEQLDIMDILKGRFFSLWLTMCDQTSISIWNWKLISEYNKLLNNHTH